MLYCLFIAASYPGSGVVLDVSFPDLCRLSYFVTTCWERAELLSLLCVMFSSVFVNFPYGVSGQVWYFLIFAYFLTLYNMLTHIEGIWVQHRVSPEQFIILSFVPLNFDYSRRLAVNGKLDYICVWQRKC